MASWNGKAQGREDWQQERRKAGKSEWGRKQRTGERKRRGIPVGKLIQRTPPKKIKKKQKESGNKNSVRVRQGGGRGAIQNTLESKSGKQRQERRSETRQEGNLWIAPAAQEGSQILVEYPPK